MEISLSKQCLEFRTGSLLFACVPASGVIVCLCPSVWSSELGSCCLPVSHWSSELGRYCLPVSQCLEFRTGSLFVCLCPSVWSSELGRYCLPVSHWSSELGRYCLSVSQCLEFRTGSLLFARVPLEFRTGSLQFACGNASHEILATTENHNRLTEDVRRRRGITNKTPPGTLNAKMLSSYQIQDNL